jgi:hypothetical protein
MTDEEKSSDDSLNNKSLTKNRKFRTLGKRGMTKHKTKRAKFQSIILFKN